jgi:hypothetical protein
MQDVRFRMLPSQCKKEFTVKENCFVGLRGTKGTAGFPAISRGFRSRKREVGFVGLKWAGFLPRVEHS